MKELFALGKKSPYIQEIKSAIKNLDIEINNFLKSDHKLLQVTALHLHKNGGKRLRPAFVYLGGYFGQYNRDTLTPMAMAMEITHMATLVHDDIVDNAPLRRGKPTVKSIWGNQASVYTGNYLLSKAMTLVSKYEDNKINKLLSDTALAMCRGEIAQLSSKDRLDKNVEEYLLRIKEKTAFLFSASCELGAYIAGAEPQIVQTLKEFGENLGMAFQITDDILDYSPEAKKFGKIPGGDIREGTMTLPLIYTAAQEKDTDLLQTIFAKKNKSEEDVNIVIDIVKKTGGLEYAKREAAKYTAAAEKNLENLPPNELRETLKEIAATALKRQI